MNEIIRTAVISPLRQRMIDDMNVRRFSRETQRNYIRDVGRFATFLRRPPDTATPDEVRQFQIERKVSLVRAANFWPSRRLPPMRRHCKSRAILAHPVPVAAGRWLSSKTSPAGVSRGRRLVHHAQPKRCLRDPARTKPRQRRSDPAAAISRCRG